jgi:hypothetical protein
MTYPPTPRDSALQTYEWGMFTNRGTLAEKVVRPPCRPVSRHFVTSHLDIADSA